MAAAIEEAAILLARAAKSGESAAYFGNEIRSILGLGFGTSVAEAARQAAVAHDIDPRAIQGVRSYTQSGYGAPGFLIPQGRTPVSSYPTQAGPEVPESTPLLRNRFGRRPLESKNDEYVDVELGQPQEQRPRVMRKPRNAFGGPAGRGIGPAAMAAGGAAAVGGIVKSLVGSDSSENSQTPEETKNPDENQSSGSTNPTTVQTTPSNTSSTSKESVVNAPTVPGMEKSALSYDSGGGFADSGVRGRWKVPLKGVYRPVQMEPYSRAALHRMLYAF